MQLTALEILSCTYPFQFFVYTNTLTFFQLKLFWAPTVVKNKEEKKEKRKTLWIAFIVNYPILFFIA